MAESTFPVNNTTASRLWPALAGVLLLAIIIAGCICYLLTDYTHLADWYTSLHSCFYKNSTWRSNFFTPRIKSDGNMYCSIAIGICVLGIRACIRRIKSSPTHADPNIRYHINRYDIIGILSCIVTTIAFWAWGNHMVLPAADEIFSAENVASIHPLQGVSYYMLPNNHVLFNLINNLLFHFAANKVVTGRIISLIAYCGTFVCVFLWLRQLLQSRLLAYVACAALALQLHVWGMGFQARGYELYLFAQWSMLLSLFSYLVTGQKKWLYINTLCCVVGYFCIPSFLYIHVAQLLFTAIYQFLHKKTDRTFWQYQFLVVLLTFLCYLPVLCFSGLEAITHNQYVRPVSNITFYEFAKWFFPAFSFFLTNMFSDIAPGAHYISLLLFLLPVTLLFARKHRPLQLFGLFYLLLWLIFFLFVLGMKRCPFERNIIAHYSITLTGILLVVYWASDGLARATGKAAIKWLLLPTAAILLSIHFIKANPGMLPTTLYGYDVNKYYTQAQEKLAAIPTGSTVAISDQSFYYGYICVQRGCKVNKCANGDEQYFVIEQQEPWPSAVKAANYTFLFTCDDYDVYRKKQN